MKIPEMRAFLIHMSPNNWRKKGTKPDFYLDEEDFIYRDEMICEKDIWRKVTDFLPECGINTLLIDVEDGVIYDKHPELAIKGSWTKEELKNELDRLRSIGLTPLPKCNFSCGHNAWLKDYAYMVGTPVYNEVCVDIINELIDLFDTPEFMHLGLEEEDVGLMEECYPVTVLRSHFKKAEDAKVLFDACRAKGVRPWIWAGVRDVQSFGGDELFRKYVGTDVLLSSWHYSFLRYSEDMRERYSVADYCCKFDEWGYEQVPTTSTWFWHLNHKETMRFAKNFISETSLKGHLAAPWMHTTRKRYYQLLSDADIFGNAFKDIYCEE